MFSSLAEKLIVRAQRWRISRDFRANLGYAGNFENPRTHQEKVQFRKLYGNHEFYAMVSDKHRVRDYVAAKVGAEYLVPQLGVYERLRASDFDPLPNEFIIKANHGCKWHRIVRDKRELDVAATVRYFNRMMRRRYGWIACERHYNFIEPRIVIDELLHDDADGGLPWDYSFFCYHGPRGFDFNYAVCSPTGKAATLTKDGAILVNTLTPREYEARFRPANFDQLVEVAEALSADFDFIRVDLYSVRGKVYFGELTCTPHQGYGAIKSPVQQRMRDEMWQLDVGNPRLYHRPGGHRRRDNRVPRPAGLTAR